MSDTDLSSIGRHTVYGVKEAAKHWPSGAQRRPSNLPDTGLAGSAAEQMAQLARQHQPDSP